MLRSALVVIVLLGASSARAQPRFGRLTTGYGGLLCAQFMPCDPAGSRACLPPETRCRALEGPGAVRADACVELERDAFCCDDVAVCPTLGGDAGRCVMLTDAPGTLGVCVYGADGCGVGASTTFASFGPCVRAPGHGSFVVRWDEGDCDDDGAPNATDPCPCDSACRPDAGPIDAGVDAGVDAGEPGADSGSEPPDSGTGPADAGAGADFDATTAGLDAASFPRRDGSSSFDAARVTPVTGVPIGGGCDCRAAGPTERSRESGPIVLTLLLGAVVWRRLRLRRPLDKA